VEVVGFWDILLNDEGFWDMSLERLMGARKVVLTDREGCDGQTRRKSPGL
jgi:hypothetical protein